MRLLTVRLVTAGVATAPLVAAGALPALLLAPMRVGAQTEPAPSAASDGAAATYRVELSGGRLLLNGSDGKPLFDLTPRVRVAYAAATGEPQPRFHEELLPAAFRIEREASGAWVARAEVRTSAADFDLRIAPSPSGLGLLFVSEARYREDVLVNEEVLELEAPRATEAVMPDRAFVERAVRRVAIADATGSMRVRLRLDGREMSLIASEGYQALRVQRSDHRLHVALELDASSNHPFEHFAACNRSPRQPTPALVDLSWSFRRRGSSRRAEALWLLGPTHPVDVSRFPRGFAAAVVFVDHADRSTPARLEAFAFGRTGALGAGAVGDGHPGFVNRGLAYTKTVFVETRRPADRLDAPEMHALLDELQRRGVEIGLHSVTARRDDPVRTRALLREFREGYAGATWVDHSPATNCEAIGNSGWDPHGRWFVMHDVLAQGFRFFWSGADRRTNGGSLNLLAPAAPAARRPVLYEHPGLAEADAGAPGPVPVMFASRWMFVPAPALLLSLSPPRLERLAEERGLVIGHVYLETTQESRRYGKRSLLRKTGPGTYALRPEVDALFAQLQARQAAGQIWTAGLMQVAEHLLAREHVALGYRKGGELVLVSHAAAPIRGLTLLLPPGATVRPDAPAVVGRSASRPNEVWVDLEPGREVSLEVIDAVGRPFALAEPSVIELGAPRAALPHAGPVIARP